MIEGFAREMPEDDMVEAIMCGPRTIIARSCDMQRGAVDQGRRAEKTDCRTPPDRRPARRARSRSTTTSSSDAKQTSGKQARADAVKALKDQVVAELIPDPKARGAIHARAGSSRRWHALEEQVVRDLILEGKRIDGRDTKTLRTSTARSTCCRACTARPCSSAARRRPWSPSRWAPAATSSASTA